MKKHFLSVFALALFAGTAAAQTNYLRTVDQVAVDNQNTAGKEVYIVLGNNSAARINTEGGKVAGHAKGSLVRIVTVNADQHLYKIYDVKSGKWFANKGGNESAPKQPDQVELSETATEWFIYNNNNGTDATKIDIVPKVTGASIDNLQVASWNFHGGYEVGKQVGYWDANDGNSVWSLYDPKTEIKSNIEALAAADAAAAETAKSELNAASDEAGYEAAVKKFRKALNGKQVRFSNTARGAKNYLTLAPSFFATGDATEAPGAEDVFVLKYDEANDNYSLQHAVTGRNLNNVPGYNRPVASTNENNARYDLYATGTNNTLSICNVTKNEDKNCLHLSADTYTDGKLNVVRWAPGNTSPASVWKLESASATDTELLAAAKKRFSDLHKGKEIGYELGTYGYSAEANTILSGPKNLSTFQQLISLHAENRLFGLNMPEAGEFFRIKSNNGKRYVTAKDATPGEYQLKTTEDATDNGTIFYYDEDKRIVSYTTGRAIYRTSDSKSKLAPYSVTNLATVEFGALADGKYKMLVKKDGNAATVFLHQDGKTDVDGLGGDNTSKEQTHLQLENVDKFPVHFNDKGLATFFAPVSMEVPENVEIYVATAYDPIQQRINLKQFAGKVIPGGTAVLLHGASSSDIKIGYYYGEEENPVAQPENNLFKGAATPSQIATGQEARALKGDEFLVLSTQYVRGFRAFLSTAAGGGTRSQLAFPGVTGVERVATGENAAAPIFDLSGRRVEKPVAGQIYVQNGQKFLQR